MGGTRDEARTPAGRGAPDDRNRPDGAAEDAGEIEGLGLQPGAEDDRPGPGRQPQDPPEELEEERRG